MNIFKLLYNRKYFYELSQKHALLSIENDSIHKRFQELNTRYKQLEIQNMHLSNNVKALKEQHSNHAIGLYQKIEKLKQKLKSLKNSQKSGENIDCENKNVLLNDVKFIENSDDAYAKNAIIDLTEEYYSSDEDFNGDEEVEKLISKFDKNKKKTKRKKPIPKSVKRLVWNKWIGEEFGIGTCLCCKVTNITQMSFHCGHIISEFNGGEINLDNLKPICSSCNLSMGKRNMEEFMAEYKL
jgi:5-methylcytosine-specific restriction endonuclease McrA